MPEARHLLTGLTKTTRRGERLLAGLEEARALGRGPDDDGPDAENARRDGALEGLRIGRERDPRRDVRGHQPVLGDRDEHEVKEKTLLLGRLAACEQEMEVLGEREAAH